MYFLFTKSADPTRYFRSDVFLVFREVFFNLRILCFLLCNNSLPSFLITLGRYYLTESVSNPNPYNYYTLFVTVTSSLCLPSRRTFRTLLLVRGQCAFREYRHLHEVRSDGLSTRTISRRSFTVRDTSYVTTIITKCKGFVMIVLVFGYSQSRPLYLLPSSDPVRSSTG